MATDHDSSIIVPPASAELVSKIESKREQTNARVFLLDNPTDASAVWVVKVLPRQRRLWLRRFLTRMAYRLLVKKTQKPQPAKRGIYAHEVNRLLWMKSKGILVPDVIAATDEWVVMSNAGESVEEPYKKGTPEQKQELMVALAEDLANFHQKNCWHGGAQIRNVHRLPEGFCRFDFEEDLDRDLPLPALQVMDLLMFVSSLLEVKRDVDIDVEIARVKPALDAYQKIFSHPAQKSMIRGAVAFLRKILILLKVFPEQGGKERRRILVIIGLFNHF